MIPHRIVPGWLGEEQASALLAFALARQSEFQQTKVAADARSPGRVDDGLRRSLVLRDLGPFHDLLHDKALAEQVSLEAAFGMARFEVRDVEIELVAHGDGDYFHRHIDTLTRGGTATDTVRQISLVYYLHGRPAVFSGGALRLHAIGGGDSVTIDPTHDGLVGFPSFLPHEVGMVSCPSGGFADSRFSVNIWLSR